MKLCHKNVYFKAVRVHRRIRLVSLIFSMLCLNLYARGNGLKEDPHDNTLQDIIYLSNGSEVVVEISTLGASTVSFIQYDTDEPFSIDLKDVSKIKLKTGREIEYKNGVEVKHNSASKTSTSKTKTKRRKR